MIEWSLALVLAAVGGWPVTAGILRLAARSGDAGPTTADGAPQDADEAPQGVDDAHQAAGHRPADRSPADHSPAGPDSAHARAVLRGGTWIGLLERTGVALAVLAGQPTAIAFVIAIKGLGRYPELRTNPEASERFVIGSLASMTWAVSVTLAVTAVVG